ncbi:MAG: response regulator transcription factor [Cellulomonadaceae bacterium]|nr:response regulator transcription factor [Cellulomonadaceae bacterium]
MPDLRPLVEADVEPATSRPAGWPSTSGAPTGRVWRIGAVDARPIVLAGISLVLLPCDDLDLVGASETVRGLLDAQPDLDLVVIDTREISHQRAGSLALLREAGVLVLDYSGQPAPGSDTAPPGTVATVSKDASVEVLIDAIRRAVASCAPGEVVAPHPAAPRPAVRTSGALHAAEVVPGGVRLTPRESEVLGLYASGLKAVRVAHQLGVSRETVLDHLRRIRVKYAADGRPASTKIDLYRRAVEDGMLPPPT